MPDQLPFLLGEGSMPGNSPELSPTENLSAIVQERIEKMDPAKSEATPGESDRSAFSLAQHLDGDSKQPDV